MSSKKLKVAIALLLANALALAGYVVALYRGVSLPFEASSRAWTDVAPDVVVLVVFSLLAALGMARRTTSGFALGMIAAGAYLGGPGSNVLRFIVHRTQLGAAAGSPAPVTEPIPLVSIYFFVFGVVLAIYLWSRRRVFAVGV